LEQERLKVMKKITGMLDILICLLLFISALYKGGFYKEDSLFINMIICMLGLVCLSVKIVLNIVDNRKVKKSKLGTIVDICVLLMPIVYFLPVVFNTYASKESAIFESIRYVNFAIIYFIVRTTQNKKIYTTSILVIGVVLAILGIDEITYRAIGKVLEPLSITYLQSSGNKISSTLQYANITALFMLISSIIVQNKLIKNLPKLETEKHLRFKVLVVAELFSLILLQSSIVLTTSRMNTLLMIIASIIYSVYCVKKGKKKSALMITLMLVAAFVLVTSIDNYLLLENNFMVCFTYIITLVLIIIVVLLSTKFKVINSKQKKQLPKWLLPVTILGCIIIALVLSMPDDLRVNSEGKESTTVNRNIYVDLEQTMDLEVTFNFIRNDSFVMEFYEFDEEFNKKNILRATQESVKNNKYVQKLQISEEAERIMFTFKTMDSDIEIESLKLNGKEITLSYMFIPDSLVFRLKDTLIKDPNNTLRFTYYKDAIKLFNTSKFFGIGGEGFKARYQEVQTESYVSSEVHSVPLQILVECGLVGFITFAILCIATCIIVSKVCKNKNEDSLSYVLIFTVFGITAIFDLVFSFGIMIYLFAVIIGLVIGEYKQNITLKDKYELDNKSMLGMLKIATLSISLMALFMVTLYSVNIYRASMIIVPDVTENLDESYERVGLLENKIELDKYNLAYLNSLLAQYDTHIDLLNDIYLLTQDDNERFVLKTEINNYIARQKQIADNIIEYEYYNKYAIEKVARCYFKRYVSYADIFNHNFKNDEIAYVFYVGYGIKLTERLIEIGPVNKLAKDFAIEIYEEYLPVIENQNKIINSDMLSQAIEDMKNKLEDLKSVNI